MTSPDQDKRTHIVGSAERWNRTNTARRMGTALLGVVEDVVFNKPARLDQLEADHTQATWMRMYHSMNPVEGTGGQLPAATQHDAAPMPEVAPQQPQPPHADQQK